MNPQHAPQYLRSEFPDVVARVGDEMIRKSLGVLAKRVSNDWTYGSKFLTTLEINKAEANLREFSQPRPFAKIMDDLSIVQDFVANPEYSFNVRNSFNQYEVAKVLQEISINPMRFCSHFSLSSIENILASQNPEFKENLVLKKVDNNGLIVDVRIHDKLAEAFNKYIDAEVERLVERKIKGE